MKGEDAFQKKGRKINVGDLQKYIVLRNVMRSSPKVGKWILP